MDKSDEFLKVPGANAEPPKRERSFRNLFRKKSVNRSETTFTTVRSHDSGYGSSPPMSPVSDLSFKSNDSHDYKKNSDSSAIITVSGTGSGHGSGSGTGPGAGPAGHKLGTKWYVKSHNLDKQDETDQKTFEFHMHLIEHYYDVFNYNWQEIAEHYLFGNTVAKVFSNKQGNMSEKQLLNVLMNWLLLGGDQFGEEDFYLSKDFQNDIDIYMVNNCSDIKSLFRYFTPLVNALDVFKQAISYFKENTEDYDKLKEKNTHVDILHNVANKKGFPIPLSQALLANWLIQFSDNREGSEKSFFEDEDIIKYFRKCVRNALVIKLLYTKGLFNELVEYVENQANANPQGSIKQTVSMYQPNQEIVPLTNQELQVFVSSFLVKDNQTALGIGLYGIANYWHVKKHFNKGINLFEISSNLTFDLDCCNMAAMGLSNGYGFGKKHGKEYKFQRKKRLAKIYRIMNDHGGNLDVGTSWAFKPKYD